MSKIERARNKCSGWAISYPFHTFDKMYPFTTENISGYIDNFDLYILSPNKIYAFFYFVNLVLNIKIIRINLKLFFYIFCNSVYLLVIMSTLCYNIIMNVLIKFRFLNILKRLYH